jgi:hypothetical protein
VVGKGEVIRNRKEKKSMNDQNLKRYFEVRELPDPVGEALLVTLKTNEARVKVVKILPDTAQSAIFQVVQERDRISVLLKGEWRNISRVLALVAQANSSVYHILGCAQVVMMLWESIERREPMPMDGQQG